MLVALGVGVGPSPEARATIARAVAAVAASSPGLMATEAVRDVLLALVAPVSEDRFLQWFNVASAFGAIAKTPQGQRVLATADVRDLLLAFCRCAAAPMTRHAVLVAIRNIAGCEQGRRVLGREAVCDLLEVSQAALAAAAAALQLVA